MKIFCIDEFPNGNTVCMHCAMEEEASIFLAFLDSIGRTWCNGQSYLDVTAFDQFREDTCYFFNSGTFDSLQYAESRDGGCTIILEFSDFEWEQPLCVQQ